MDMSRLTTKSQEAIQAAQTKAIRYGHLEVDGEHLLLALLEQADGLVPKVLQKLEISVEDMKERIEEELEKKARVSGPGVEPGKIYVSQRFQRLLVKAQDEAQRL